MLVFKSLIIRLFFLFVISLSYSVASAQYNLIVAKDGSGNYASVQAAINAAPTGRTTPYIIYIKNGRYKEKINIPSNKPFIQLIGEDVARVILTYDDYASKMVTCNTTLGTQNSASFTVNANDFSAINITFENTFGDGSQAVTILVNADRAFFENCRFLGNQDTVYLKGAGAPRNYFKDCYIDGNIDFVFGSAIAVFDSCVVYAKRRGSAGSSYITAPNTPNGQAYGFVFRGTKFPNNTGGTSYYLSRPWASPDVASTRQKAVLLNCLLSSHIQPAGWSIWDANTVTANLYNAEYSSRFFNGNLVDVSQRAPWSYQLTSADSSSYTFANFFGTWNPCGVSPNNCNPTQRNIVISNIKSVRNANSTQFSWNISWPVQGIQYDLYRSADNINYAPVYTYTSATDTAANFTYTDLNVPASGSKYYYYISASKAGYNPHVTDTVIISNAQNLVVNASAALSLCGFSQPLGSPSAAQTFTVSGTNLTANIIITPPLNFEVSTDNINWYNSSSSLQVSPVSGGVPETVIYVRLNSPIIGNSSGDVNIACSDVDSILVPLTGSTFGAPTSFLLQQWPLITNNDDSLSVRSFAVTPSTSKVNTVTNKLYTSDGTQPLAAPIPAYSGKYGQALGANLAGNSWTNIGSTLNRNYYEEFDVTASAGNNIKIDSITFLSDFYQTASGIKMSAVFSKNGFSSPADSTEIYSGVNSSGTSLTLSANGNFSKSFPLLQSNAGPINYYALSLNGPSGVTINAGETLSIRLYWACGSTSVPRFAFLKNVSIKGVVLNATPCKLILFKGNRSNKKVKLIWQTTNEINLNHFEIEKSTDGLNFVEIGETASRNNLNFNEYTFEDNLFETRTVYYRLKMLDDNGKMSYSQIISIREENANRLNIHPNPVSSNFVVGHEKAFKGNTLVIVNNLGEIVLVKNAAEGSESTILNVSLLPASVYTIKFNNNGNCYTQQFIKQ